jgi:hypothetical protein
VGTSPPTLDETTQTLTRIAHQLEELSRAGIHLSRPAALVEAAERVVKAMVANRTVTVLRLSCRAGQHP